MENKVIQDRLALLRKKMQEEGIDFYMMPSISIYWGACDISKSLISI